MKHNEKLCFDEATKSTLATPPVRVGRILRSHIFPKLILLLLLTVAASGRPEEVIRITGTIGPPMTSADSNGIADLLIVECFRRIDGYEARVENFTVSRALSAVNDGLTDGLSGRAAGMGKIYPNILQVPESFIDFEFIGFSKRADIRLRDWEDLRPYNVTYPSSWLFYANQVRAKSTVKARTYDQLFDLLQQDRVDIVLFEKLSGMYQLKQRSMIAVTMIKLPSDPVKLYLYLNKKHAALVPLVTNALRAMQHDGSYREIYNSTLRRYLGDSAPLLE